MGIEYYLLSKNQDTCLYLHKIDRAFSDGNIEDIGIEELRHGYYWGRRIAEGLLKNPRTFFQLLDSNDIEQLNDDGIFVQKLIENQL